MLWLLLLLLLPLLAHADDRADLAAMIPRAASGTLDFADHAALTAAASGDLAVEAEALRAWDASVRVDPERHCAAAAALLALRDDADTRIEAARCALLTGKTAEAQAHVEAALPGLNALPADVAPERRSLALRLQALAAAALATDDDAARAAASLWTEVGAHARSIGDEDLAAAADAEAEGLTAFADEDAFYKPARALREGLPKGVGGLLVRLSQPDPATISEADPGGFRESSWGDSRRTVQKAEGRDPERWEGDRVFYGDGLLGERVGVVYRFDGDDLFEGAYVFGPRSSRRARDARIQYEELKAMLIVKYGEPLGDDERWSNRKLKERGVDKNQALEYGDLQFRARWELGTTVIRLRLRNDDGTLKLRLRYTEASRAPRPKPKDERRKPSRQERDRSKL